MKKVLPALFSVLIVTVIILSYNHINTIHKYGDYQNKEKITSKFKKGTKGADPAFEEFILSEKVKEGEKIPYGQRSKWMAHEAIHNVRKSSVSPFTDIVEYGPKNIGGRTRAIHIDPRDGNKVFSGGISGGLWVSNDRAVTWQPINDHAPNLSVTSITYNPFNPDIIYYSTGEPRGGGGIGEGVFKSTDNGQSFQQLPSSIETSAFRLSWRIKHSLVDSNTIYVATNSGLYVSANAGDSWDLVELRSANNTIRVFDILPFSDGGLMVSSRTGVYYSATGASQSFTNLNLPGGGSYDRTILAYCKSQQDVVYAMSANDFGDNAGAPLVFKSTNRGVSWDQKSATLTLSSQLEYNMLLHVHPTNPDRVISGAVVANQSNNGGNSWGLKGVGHFDYHAAVTFPDDDNSLLIGNDGGVYEHRWNAPFFRQSKNKGYNTTQFYAGSYSPMSTLAIGGMQDNGTVTIKENQSISIFGLDGGYAHIHQQDPNTAYFSTQFDGLYRTQGIQQNISIPTSISYAPMYDEGVDFINTYEMNYADGNQLYYRTDLGLWRTSNRGNRWQKINTSDYIRSIQRITLSEDKDPQIFTFGQKPGFSNSLLHIKNGLTDTLLETRLELEDFPEIDNESTINHDIHPNNNDRIIFANYNYTNTRDQVWLLKNVNNSSTLESVTGNLPDNLPVNTIKFHPFDPNNIFIAGTDFGLYYTLDGGVNWLKEDNLPNVAVYDIRIRKEDGRIFFFTYGRGVWIANLEVAPPLVATLPYFQDFETGNIDQFSLIDRSNNTGRVKVNPKQDEGYNLAFDLSLETNQKNTCSFSLNVNTSGIEKMNIQYNYWINEADIDAASGLYISFNDGNSYSQIRSFSELATDTSLTDSLLIDIESGSNAILKFQYKGSLEAPTGGFYIDNINLEEEEEIIATSTFSNVLKNLKVYPNPATSNINIDGLKADEVALINLVGSDGKVHHQWPVVGTNSFNLPENLSKGIYQLVFKNNTEVLGSKGLVIE